MENKTKRCFEVSISREFSGDLRQDFIFSHSIIDAKRISDCKPYGSYVTEISELNI